MTQTKTKKKTAEDLLEKQKRKKIGNLPAIRTEEVGLVPVNLNALMEAAIKKGAGIDTLERLVALRLQLEQEAARKAYFAALAAFQQDCPIIPKTKTVFNRDGKTIRYRYAPIEVIIEHIKQPLSLHGLSYTLDVEQPDGGTLTGIFYGHHIDGHKETTKVKVPIANSGNMNAAQEVISARTYSVRIALCNGLGLATVDEDDDGNSIGEPEKKKPDLRPPQARPVNPEVAIPESVIRIVEDPPVNPESSAYVEIIHHINAKEQSKEGPMISLFASAERVYWKAKADKARANPEEMISLLQELDAISDERKTKIKEGI